MISCAGVAPEVRERVRAAGACVDPPDTSAVERRAAEPPVVPRKAVGQRPVTAPRGGASVRVAPPALPSVIGGTIDEAQARLQNFTIERVDRASQAPVGQVIDQVPGASAPVAAGSRVVVFVSSGPAAVQLPSVIDRSFEDASGALTSFAVERREVPGAAPAGRVLVQRPAAGSAVTPGSRVVLQVSDGSLAAAAVATPAPVPQAENAVVLPTATALALALAILLIGFTFGALAMRQRRPRSDAQPAAAVVPTMSTATAMPAKSTAAMPATSAAAAMPAMVSAIAPPPLAEPTAKFFARLDAGETSIQFARTPDDDMLEEHAHARDE